MDRKLECMLPSRRHADTAAYNLSTQASSLRLVAFSDYRVHDIELFIEEVKRLRPQPDLVVYAGDDIRRFRPSPHKNLFEALASLSRYGLCAVAGNDDLPEARNLISGSGVFNVHLRPVVVGDFAVLGLEGAPFGPGFLLHPEREIASHLHSQFRSVKSKRIIVLSHAPPHGILDQALRFSPDGKARSIGSQSLRAFLRKNKNVVLVVCGHAHLYGGTQDVFGRSLVVNVANHDRPDAKANLAIIDIELAPPPRVQWRRSCDLSRVPGIGEASAKRLRDVGITSVEDLARAPIELLRRIPHLGDSREALKARALAITQDQPICLSPLSLPPAPRIFLDIETDLGQTYVWLIGILEAENGQYTALFAKRPSLEKRILESFVDFAKRCGDCNILTCSGSRFDERILRKRLLHYGLNAAICEKIVDLHWPIKRSVALPTSSYQVKEIGGFLGYQYKHPELNGLRVAQLYESQYLKLREGRKRQKLAHRLLEYNEDDVRCLPFILRAIEKLSAPTEGS